jgi:hypothetical protein
MLQLSMPSACALRLSCALGLVLVLSAPSRSNDEDEHRLARDVERSKVEAKTLLAKIIDDHLLRRHPCILADQWLGRAVDVSLARRYLGSTLYADLAAPHTATRPADIIDPQRTMRDRFCSQSEADATWEQAQAEFRSGASTAYVDMDFKQPTISFSRVEIAFPVFDAKFTTAVVVMSSARRKAAKSTTGRPSMTDGGGWSLVYRKRGGAWVQIHSNVDHSFH